MMSESSILSPRVCCFCNLTEDNELEYGKFYECDGIVTHYYCLLLSSNMEQKGKDDEGILGFLTVDIQKELRRGKKLTCSYCKKTGATLGCCNVKCKRIFHYPCGLKAGSLHQFFGEFRSYCINHRPKQKIDDYISKKNKSLDELVCCICYDNVSYKDFVGTLWAPCCKKDAWFHRKCVQQLAISAGYFFKCPLCNNKKHFQRTMLQYGIFIPSQDASWELVPNAFQELLYRYNKCDAIICICPKGRKYTSNNAKWELVLCRSCGSQGIHMACGELRWANPTWECAECTSILCDSNSHGCIESTSSSAQHNQKDSDTDDTDISVGTDFPMPCSLDTPHLPSDSNIKPGPRSYKLRQQIKANNMNTHKLELLQTALEENIIIKAAPKNVHELLSKDGYSKRVSLTNKNTNSQQKISKGDYQQGSKKNNFQQREMSYSNKGYLQTFPREEDIITIESDDDDDVEIVTLKSRIDLAKRTVRSDTSGISPEVIANLPEQSSASTARRFANPTASKNNSLINSDTISTNESSVMNIKITNVTSLTPEVFASVSNATSEDNDTLLHTCYTPALIDKISEKCSSAHVSSPKRMHEVNGIVDTNCKKVKGDNFYKTPMDSFTIIKQRVHCQSSRRASVFEPRLFQTNSDEILDGRRIGNLSKCIVSANKVSNPHDSQENDSFYQMVCEAAAEYTVEANCLKENNASQITAQRENENSLNQNSKNIYVQLPESLFLPKSTFNTNFAKNQNENITNVTYNRTSDNMVLQQVTNDNGLINNQQNQIVNQPIITNINIPVDMTNSEISVLNQQEDSSMKEKLLNNTSDFNNGSPNKAACDGDAGISPAIMPRFCFSETSKKRELSNKFQSRDKKSFKQGIPNRTDTIIYSPKSSTCNVFPQVTNNHNTCHQPRLIPQYMHLHDLKFRIYGSNTLQMILYDTFSVNIPVENTTESKTGLNIAAQERKESTIVSQARDKTSFNIDHVDNVQVAKCIDKFCLSLKNENHLNNDKTNSMTSTVCTVNIHDETKENLDPISNTLSNNGTLSNINLNNDIDNTIINDYICTENNSQTCCVSNDNNLNTLSQPIHNANVDSIENIVFIVNDCDQDSRINLDCIQHKQSVCNSSALMEEKIANRSFSNRLTG